MGSKEFYRWWRAEDQRACKITFDLDVRIRLRDGTLVSADIYRPADASPSSPVPVVLTRNMFRRRYDPANVKLREPAKYIAEHGYAVVTMDARGRGNSEGEFDPSADDGADGYDGVEWCAQQTWSTGQVGMFGGSISARSALFTAITQPPHLRTIILKSTTGDPFLSWPTGAPSPTDIMFHYFLSSRDAPPPLDNARWLEIFRHLPLFTMDEQCGVISASWRSELAHTQLDEFWRQRCYSNRLDQILIPALHIAGWYDDSGATLGNFTALHSRAERESTMFQKLIVGPWDHKAEPQSELGKLQFDPTARLDIYGYYVRWFDQWLKDKDSGLLSEARVHLYIIGANTWRTAASWPLVRAQATQLYLHSAGSANNSLSSGTLEWDQPAAEHEDHFCYDPADPAPYLVDLDAQQLGGPDDYAIIEDRPDILVYTSRALTSALEVTGPIKAALTAATNARDTDFTVKLLDVWPDGFAQRLCDGLVRARFRNGFAEQSLLQPGEIEQYQLDCGFIAHVFKAGHKIRVEISSSAFPKFDRNLNTGDSIALGETMNIAEQTIYHGGRHQSFIILPVVVEGAAS